MSETTLELLSADTRTKIDSWLEKYPNDQKQSAVIPALHLAQEQHGYLSEPVMDAVADYLEMPKIAVYEVATFYSMYDLKPVGRHKIGVCNSISCMLRGSEKLIHHLEKKLGVKEGQTTADGKFTLKEVECLGACVGAPACWIGKKYHENMTEQELDKLLQELQ